MTPRRAGNAAEVDKFLRDLERELPVTMSLREVARALKCSPRTVSRLIAGGELRVVRALTTSNARAIIPRSEVIRWLAARIV